MTSELSFEDVFEKDPIEPQEEPVVKEKKKREKKERTPEEQAEINRKSKATREKNKKLKAEQVQVKPVAVAPTIPPPIVIPRMPRSYINDNVEQMYEEGYYSDESPSPPRKPRRSAKPQGPSRAELQAMEDERFQAMIDASVARKALELTPAPVEKVKKCD